MARKAGFVAPPAVSPMRQGQLDCLCGLYSAINAIQLALADGRRLRKPQLNQLFDYGIKFLHGSGKLSGVLRCGMPERTWMALCCALMKRATKLTGVKLKCAHVLSGLAKTDMRGALQRLAHHTGQGRPVLVALWGAHNHYTVVTGCTAARLSLFDSADLSWVSVRTCELHHATSTKRHQISRRSATLICRA